MKRRAFSFLEVKSVDNDRRVIRGMATTPEPDRVGDVVEPMGAQFKNPAPLLWMHRHDAPVGSVTFGTPTEKGIPFEATLPKVEQPSGLAARIDEAWESIKNGLVRAVSIGFRPLEYSVMEDTGGYRFTKTDIYELSLVTVPANAGATIDAIKSIDDQALRAASGAKDGRGLREKTAGASASIVTITQPPKEGKTMKISEQLKQFRASRAAKLKRMKELTEGQEDSAETLGAADAEEFETLQNDLKAIDKHIERLETVQKAEGEETAANAGTDAADASNATAVTKAAGEDPAAAAAARSKATQPVRVKEKEEAGLALARVVKCLGVVKGNHHAAAELARQRYANDPRIENILKAAVAAGTTTNGTWAGPLVGEESRVFADFVEFLRPQTILGKFGAGNVPALRRVPFRTRLISQTTGGQGFWVGEAKPKPLTKFDFAGTTLDPLKVANIAVITDELLRDSSPSADVMVRDSLVAALKERLDIDFIDPAKAAVSNVSPASITNGITPVTSSGSSADDIRQDLRALMGKFVAANNPPTTGVLVMSAMTALALSLMTNPLGQSEFPNLTMAGGTLAGLPVITSEYVPTDTSGSYVFLINASDIYFADEGGFEVDMSREASLQMVDNPQDGAQSLVSMFQNNLTAFRAERTVNWARRRNSGVAVLDDVNWGINLS